MMNRLEKKLDKFLDFLDTFEGDKNFYDTSCTDVKIGDINYVLERKDVVFNDERQGYSFTFYDCVNKWEYILDLHEDIFIELFRGNCMDCVCFRSNMELSDKAYYINQEWF